MNYPVFIVYRDDNIIGLRWSKELAEACVTVDKRVYVNSVYKINEATLNE